MLRLNVGTNRKIGQPDFGSAGASCNLELELDTALFQDVDGLQQVVRRAYSACNQAVNDELSRLTHHDGSQHHDAGQNHDQPALNREPVVEVRTTPAINGATVTRIQPAQFTTHPSPRPATTSQVRAIRAICSRRKIDLVAVDGGRKQRRGDRVAAVQNGGAQPCRSLGGEDRGDSPDHNPFQREAQECIATWRSGARYAVRC
jgi:hypothetical protein